MRNWITGMLLAATVCGTAAAAAPEPAKAAPPKVKVGDMAPDFTLLAFDGTSTKPVSLHDYRGKKNVMLAFFVFAFTGG